jgi:hypothetical protein
MPGLFNDPSNNPLNARSAGAAKESPRMSRRLPLVLALSLLSLALAGCIQGPAEEDAGANETTPGATLSSRDAGGDARMSAREEKSESAGSCSKGYCIEQTVKVTGALQDLALLEVDLSTLNGGVKVTAGAEGQWSMVAKLTSKASSREAAEAAMRDLRFVWSHEDGGSHLLDAKATFEGRHNGVDRGADISVVMPRSLVLRLVAETTNGGVDVKGVRTDGLSAGTTNGGVDVDADVTQVDLGTTNGGIDARLRPTASGRIRLGTTNGGIQVAFPEDAQHGYDLDAGTTNGDVSIRMRDGDVGPCPEGSQYYTPPCDHRTFKTRNYDQRAIRSQVELGTTNGRIEAASA